MFTKASDFNQDIGSWSVSKVKNMEFMFGYAKSFNQDISSWDISSVEKIGGLFFDAEKFNQDISSWDISKINSLQEMFKDAYTFNQDLSSWNFSNIDNMIDFMENSNLSTTNYDKLLRAWVSGDIQDNVSLSVGDTKYNKQAESTRFELINQHGWSITDGGLNN
jgi:surface protein